MQGIYKKPTDVQGTYKKPTNAQGIHTEHTDVQGIHKEPRAGFMGSPCLGGENIHGPFNTFSPIIII